MGEVLEKRFKVVQDATGEWGILDTLAVEFESDTVRAFAPYGFAKGSVCRWVHLIRDHAISLNARRMDRDDFSWEQYEPREDLR